MSKFSKEIKNEVLKDFCDEIRIDVICMRYGVSRATIYNWAKKEKKIKGTEILYIDFYNLERKLQQKTLELEIYEKLHCFKDSTIAEKERAVAKYVGTYPIKTMCRLIDLPTGTAYNYLRRRKEEPEYQKRDDILKGEINRVYYESGRRFGAKKITAKLQNEGVHTTMRKVQQLMKEMGIESIQLSQRRVERVGKMPESDENKLQRKFNQTEPNKYWVGDVTEVRVNNTRVYLCVIMDLFSRKIIAYRMAHRNDTNLTIETFEDAFFARGCPQGLIFHSDRGANYASKYFVDMLDKYSVGRSLSRAHNPYDNACIESFFACLKREEYYARSYENVCQLKEGIAQYIDFFNDYRPHEALKNKSPNQYENDYFDEKSNKKATT